MSKPSTCFKVVDYDLSGLLHYIEKGDIGLPDIQRPFVWSNAKVRDLFDSMFRGFPVGYLLFWENTQANGVKPIGLDQKQHTIPSRVIVDGQQRLTSLYAVLRGHRVLDSDYTARQIQIAFRPRDASFEVSNAAIRRDPEWIPNISTLWASGKSSYQVVKGFLSSLSNKVTLTEDDEEIISHNLDRLFDLQKYPFTALEIAPSVDEEQVADIFVRINSEGVKLNQADFILTLLSVFWEEGRHDLEGFCHESRKPPVAGSRPSPYNHLIKPDPDQLLRVSVAFGFMRGRLKSVYQVLRGKDPDTYEFHAEKRDYQFAVLKSAQEEVLDLTAWHQFLSAIHGAGFRSEEMVSSQSALLYAYAFYLFGRKRFGVSEHKLQKLIGRWFFFASLTGRYTNSPESVMDGDLNLLKDISDADSFIHALDEVMDIELTRDYWAITLPMSLNSSSARNPELFAYVAAQNLLGARVLFSHKYIKDLVDPSLKPKKKPLERHHLFPRAHLEKLGITDLKLINQQANLALLEWPDNIDIGGRSPSEYVPTLKSRFPENEWRAMHDSHALPMGWETLPYDEFLIQRRRAMSSLIRKGFDSLK